jgi:hypothetical protein
MLSGKLFQFSTVFGEKECFLISVLACWETRPFTPAILRVLAPTLLFVIVVLCSFADRRCVSADPDPVFN